ncbi:MAG: c-type cytochrome [Myxococcales bacterium]|nr:c-type cytochrome [Myxococcales bacterium]MCB9752675.1 c-type cytochrome [Myxococcales bacterium]
MKVKITPERVATGEAVFRQHCASCHGAQGVGRVGIGPRLNSESFLSAASDHMLLTTIGKGRMGTTMAGFGQRISKKEQESVVAYIRSLTAHEPAELDERPLHGDIGRGGELFKSICSKCHGREGAGYIESSSGTGIRRKAFISSVSDGYLRYMVKNGKSQTKMRGFDSNAPTSVANLSDDQIEDVVTYLRKAAW